MQSFGSLISDTVNLLYVDISVISLSPTCACTKVGDRLHDTLHMPRGRFRRNLSCSVSPREANSNGLTFPESTKGRFCGLGVRNVVGTRERIARSVPISTVDHLGPT